MPIRYGWKRGTGNRRLHSPSSAVRITLLLARFHSPHCCYLHPLRVQTSPARIHTLFAPPHPSAASPTRTAPTDLRGQVKDPLPPGAESITTAPSTRLRALLERLAHSGASSGFERRIFATKSGHGKPHVKGCELLSEQDATLAVEPQLVRVEVLSGPVERLVRV